MLRHLPLALLAALLSACETTRTGAAHEEHGMNPDGASASAEFVVHDVYFELTDASPEAVQALVDGCHDYLAPLPGIVHFAAGARSPERQGGVNDVDYDVSLHVWFTDMAALEAYDTAEQHLAFIEAFRENWSGVRVFDSDTSGR